MKTTLSKSTFALFLSLSCFSFFSEFISAQTRLDLQQGAFVNGMSTSNTDEAESIIQTNDGGYAVTGYTTSYALGTTSVYILKLDSVGALTWSKAIGGSGDDEGYCIIQTTDGGYAVAGLTNSYGAGNGDAYIIKLDASGDTMWTRTIGGPQQDWAFSIIQTSDGGYAVTGFTDSFGDGNDDVYVIKLDALGNVKWNKTIGGTNTDYGKSIIQTKDGGYLVAGLTYSFGVAFNDAYFIRLDSSGNVKWSKTIGGPADDYCVSVIQTNDGNYVATGFTNSYSVSGIGSMYVIKLDTAGNIIWTNSIGGPSGQSFGSSVIQCKDSTYMLAGFIDSYSGSFPMDNMYIVHLGASGNPITTKVIIDTHADALHSIIQTKDGGYATAGYATVNTSYNFYIIKLDSALNTCIGFTTKIPSTGSGGIVDSGGIVTNPPSIIGHGGSLASGGPDIIICRAIDTIRVVAPPFTAFESSDSTFCAGKCINYTDLSANATAWKWIFPGAIPASSTDQNPQGVCYTDSGSYDVTLVATNAGGSDTLKSVNFISVHPTPSTPAMRYSHDTLFTSTDPSYISYQWYDSTALLTGQTDTILVIAISGNYSVKVTNSFGCEQAGSINVMIGIKEFNLTEPISISPNPVNDLLIVNGLRFTSGAAFEIYNMLGENVSTALNIHGTLSKVEVDVSHLAAGIYIIKSISEEGIRVGRFVKQ